jgi:hypothetical protein
MYVISESSRNRLFLLAVGLVVVLGPVVILVLTLSALVLLGDLTLGQVTLVEFLELYLIDLVVFVVLAYGVYRLTLWLVEHEELSALDTTEYGEATERSDEVSEPSEDR